MLLRSIMNSAMQSSARFLRWRYSSATPPPALFVVPPSAALGPSVSVPPLRMLCPPLLTLAVPFSSSTEEEPFSSSTDPSLPPSSNQVPFKPGLYVVGTPIGNLEDITLRALRILKSAKLILSEDTRHSGKLLRHFSIRTPLLSYHRFNESQREQLVLNMLKEGHIIALISDAGTPAISDPGAMLVKLCVTKGIPVIPIPGPSALVTALSASGLPTNEFTFVGFLPKHATSRKKRLMISGNEAATQIFYIPPHRLLQFVDEMCCIFGASRQCVMAREMTKIHEEFWRGTLEEAKHTVAYKQPKGEITFIVEGKSNCVEETPTETELENDLVDMISKGYSLSEAVKTVAAGTSVGRKTIYTLALRKYGDQLEAEDKEGDVDAQ